MAKPLKDFNSKDYDIDEVVAIGSLLHEYVHYLQYTTRNLGLLFYAARYQQYLWTSNCLQELTEHGHALRLPLMQWFEQSGDSAPPPLQHWRQGWGEYQAALATMGMGPTTGTLGKAGWDDHFNSHVRKEFANDWLPTLTLERADGTTEPVELSTSRMMETEADIVTIEILGALFPEQCEGACQELLGPADSVQRSIALPLMNHGLTHLVPIITEYCMQLPLHAIDAMRSPARVFCDMLGVVSERFRGMALEELPKHLEEVLTTISKELGVMPLDDAVRQATSHFADSRICKTGFGKMLLNAMEFRAKFPLCFLAPVGFLPRLLMTMPNPVWVCYNKGILDTERSQMESFHGPIERSKAGFEIVFLRTLLWACREIAIRPRQYICPQCQVNARWRRCSRDCGFVHQCREQLGIDLATAEWFH